MTGRTHFVYEAYDADGLLLYVGCTGHPADRYKAHMAGNGYGSGWFNPFVTRWRVTGPYEKRVAYGIERERIRDGQPIWNALSRENAKGRRGLILAYLAKLGLVYNRLTGNYQPARSVGEVAA